MREKLETLVTEMVDRGIRYDDARREFERRYITVALARANGNLCRTADLIGLHRNTLSRKIEEYRIRRR